MYFSSEDSSVSNTVSVLLVTVNTWLSFSVTCPHFVYLWFIEQMLGLFSFRDIRTSVLTAHPKAQLGHMVIVLVVACVLCGAKEAGHFCLEKHCHQVCSKSLRLS